MGGAGWGVTDLVLFELLVGGLHVDALRNLRLLHRRLLLFVQLLDVRLIVPQQRLHAQVPQVSVPAAASTRTSTASISTRPPSLRTQVPQVSVPRSSACTRKYRKYQYPAAASALVLKCTPPGVVIKVHDTM